MQPSLLTQRHALFLDFDGTLVDLAARPEQVRPDPQLPSMLKECGDWLGGAVAVLTGRRLESVDRCLTPLLLPGAGLHGSQRRERPGAPIRQHRQPVQLPAGFNEELSGLPGLWLEDKGSAVAIHYRAVPEQADKSLELLRRILAVNDGLELVSGKCVHEARPRGFDKGSALRAFMRGKAFRGRVPVFVGDDATDEDAIHAAQALNGFAIKVGPGESAARFRLIDPQAVLIWLRNSLKQAAAIAGE